MALLIRWDASDTVYISGPPSERYVHFPVEISSTVPTNASVAVSVLDSASNVIVEQSYEGLPLQPDVWTKFSPAVLVPDSFFVTPETWTLKALIYTTDVPITTPRLVTKQISNTGQVAGGRNMLLVAAGIGLLILAISGKMFK